MMLDVLIRYHFHMIFSFFNYKNIQAHMVKITRDAELDLEEDVSISYVEKITETGPHHEYRERLLPAYVSS